jgi:hypothetical protein
MGAFFASQKTGLSAPIPRSACGATAGFPLQSLSRHHLRQRFRLAGGDEEVPAKPEPEDCPPVYYHSVLLSY